MTAADKEDYDMHLRAALRHAPDRDLAPPEALTAQILADARRAVRARAQAPAGPAPSPRWRGVLAALLGALQQPAGGAALAGVVLASVIGVMWTGAPEPGESGPSRQEVIATAPPERDVVAVPPPQPELLAAVPPTARELAAPAPMMKAEAPKGAAEPRARRAQGEATPATPETSGGTMTAAAEAPSAPVPPAGRADPEASETAENAEPSDAPMAAAPSVPAAAPAAAPAGDALARPSASASDPLATVVTALRGASMPTWLEDLQRSARDRWQALPLKPSPAPGVALQDPAGRLLGHVRLDGDRAEWRPAGETTVWQADLPPDAAGRLREALATPVAPGRASGR